MSGSLHISYAFSRQILTNFTYIRALFEPVLAPQIDRYLSHTLAPYLEVFFDL